MLGMLYFVRLALLQMQRRFLRYSFSWWKPQKTMQFLIESFQYTLSWREIIQTTVVRDWTIMTFIKMYAGGGIWTHESLRNRDLGILNVIHSKLRTRLSRDLRRWPSLATPASNCLLVYLMKVGQPNLSII